MTAETIPKGSPVHAAAVHLIEAARAFWEARQQDGPAGAVVWLTDSDGQAIIFTRGEHVDTLLRAVRDDYRGPTKFFEVDTEEPTP